MKNFTAKISMPISASPGKIWEALTKPELIKQYLFGTDTDTEWKPGGPLYFRGVWEGKPYEDKGTVLEVVPEKRLSYSYWSGFSGLPDTPENYKKITFDLKRDGKKTVLEVTQENNPSEDVKKHSEGNWTMVLDGLRKLVEK